MHQKRAFHSILSCASGFFLRSSLSHPHARYLPLRLSDFSAGCLLWGRFVVTREVDGAVGAQHLDQIFKVIK